MPIGVFEREVLLVLAGQRSPDSYIGGATVLHQASDSPRASADVDIFHESSAAVRAACRADFATLKAAGYSVEPLLMLPSFQRAVVGQRGLTTKLEWVEDSAFRFFPVEADPEFGWRLNFWDAATNKVLALTDREKVRDWIDVAFLHERHLHLGALAWAAAAKDPGLTPEALLQAALRFEHFAVTERRWQASHVGTAPNLEEFRHRFAGHVRDALKLVQSLPPHEFGCLYLNAAGQPVCPDPGSPEFPKLTRHYGSLKGAWPRIVEE
jgi:hypothetical protein